MHRGSCTDFRLHRKGKSTQLLNGHNVVIASATRHAARGTFRGMLDEPRRAVYH